MIQTHEPGHPDPGLQVVYRRQFVNSGDRVGWGGDIYVGRSDYYVYLGVREARRKKTNKHSQLVIARIQQEAGNGKEGGERRDRQGRVGKGKARESMYVSLVEGKRSVIHPGVDR